MALPRRTEASRLAVARGVERRVALLQRRWAKVMDLQQFLAWWLRQLAGLIPPGLARFASSVREALVVEARGTEFIAHFGGRRLGAGRFARDAHGARDLAEAVRSVRRRLPPVVLRLAESEVLHKPLRLPLAAQSNLHQVLAFEMDRETPFTADELYWDFVVTRRDRVSGHLDVELLLVPRPVVERLAGLLRAHGLPPVALEAAESGDRPPVRLRRGWREEDTARQWQRGLVRGLVAANAALVLLLVATPFIRQQRALDAVEARLDAAQPAFEAATALRRERDRLSEAADLLQAERGRVPGPLHVLQAATNALPDDTWLTEFALRGGQLTLTGQSPSAAGIIGRLSTVPPLRDPAFTAPILRREGDAAPEQFTVVVSTSSPP